MSSWWRKDLVSPGGAGQMDAIWMQNMILMTGMGEQWRELRPGVEGWAGAEIVGNETEGEIGRRSEERRVGKECSG